MSLMVRCMSMMQLSFMLWLRQKLIEAGSVERPFFRYHNLFATKKLVGIFDVNPVLEGIAVRGIEIQMISDLPFFMKENNIEIAILTLPKNKARDMAEILIENGIKAIWNFAPTDLNLSESVCVKNVHLNESLMTLSYEYRAMHAHDDDQN